MRETKRYSCDAEVGRIGNWHRCNRRASCARETEGGAILHYCDRHEDRAKNPPPEAFRPAPMSEAYRLPARMP